MDSGINKSATVGVFIIAILLILFLVNQKPNTSSKIPVDTNSGESLSQEPTGTATISPMDLNEELKIEDMVLGTGTEAKEGQTITVNYKGTLTNGTQFDSSYDRGTPFTFALGTGEVIQGWDMGFNGMKVGGKRKITVPPSMGYGNRDLGTIPPNSTLIFEVELLEVK